MIVESRYITVWARGFRGNYRRRFRIDKIIVALLIVEKPMSPSFITGKTGTVLNVYTKPEYRNKGYAKKYCVVSNEEMTGLVVYEIRMGIGIPVSRQAFHKYLKTKDVPWKCQPLANAMFNVCREDECNDTYGRNWS